MTDNMTTDNMSNEEVIETLKGIVFNGFDRTTSKEREALDLAIKALEERPQGEYETACNVLLSLEQIVRSSDGWEDSAVEAVHNAIQTAIKALEIVNDVNHKVYRNENCPQKHKCYDYQGYHCAGCSWEKKGGAE